MGRKCGQAPELRKQSRQPAPLTIRRTSRVSLPTRTTKHALDKRAGPALGDFLQHEAISRADGNPSLAATAAKELEKLSPFATQQQSRTIQDLGKNKTFRFEVDDFECP